jgi:hypothetical protein
MEKQPHHEYRDELAGKLKEIRNSDPENPEVARAKAEGYLEAKREDEGYKNMQNIHKEEIFTEYTPVEVRADMLWDKIEHGSFSKEDLIEALRSIDELYKYGQIVPETWYYAALFDSASHKEKYHLGEKEEYDFEAMDKQLRLLRDKVEKIIEHYNDYEKFKPFNLSRADRVYSEDVYSGIPYKKGVLAPTVYEKGNESEMLNKLDRAIVFLEKFRKSPEQITREQEESAEKERLEKEEKERQVREKKMNEFDPSI